MTDHEHLVVELDESEYEQEKHVKISYKALAWIIGSIVVLLGVSLASFTGYLNLFSKASQVQKMQAAFDQVRERNKEMEREKVKDEQQISSLTGLAKTVVASYGLREDLDKPMDSDDDSAASIKESIQEFNILKAANFSRIFHHYAHQFHTREQSMPNIWPVNGTVRSSFGRRSDPFSGETAVHQGLDLSAPSGTPVRVTADGVVQVTAYSGRFGKLVVVDHGGGVKTYYGHLSQYAVVAGQEVRRGEVVAYSGATGRVTGPHLHYEIRLNGTPVNPYSYLGMRTETVAGAAGRAHNDLGL